MNMSKIFFSASLFFVFCNVQSSEQITVNFESKNIDAATIPTSIGMFKRISQEQVCQILNLQNLLQANHIKRTLFFHDGTSYLLTDEAIDNTGVRNIFTFKHVGGALVFFVDGSQDYILQDV